jgi:hypothetical protein
MICSWKFHQVPEQRGVSSCFFKNVSAVKEEAFLISVKNERPGVHLRGIRGFCAAARNLEACAFHEKLNVCIENNEFMSKLFS